VRLELVDHYQAAYQQPFHIKVTALSKIYTMEHKIPLKCIQMIPWLHHNSHHLAK
jgi:hypothetical protein